MSMVMNMYGFLSAESVGFQSELLHFIKLFLIKNLILHASEFS